MANYKEASRQDYRFTTTKGNLTVAQLWSLTVEELDKVAINLDEDYNKSGKKSFLATRSVKDKELKNKLDIVLDIMATKQEEADRLSKLKEDKEHNEKIIKMIMEKKDENLKNMSIKELEKQLRQ